MGGQSLFCRVFGAAVMSAILFALPASALNVNGTIDLEVLTPLEVVANGDTYLGRWAVDTTSGSSWPYMQLDLDGGVYSDGFNYFGGANIPTISVHGEPGANIKYNNSNMLLCSGGGDCVNGWIYFHSTNTSCGAGCYLLDQRGNMTVGQSFYLDGFDANQASGRYTGTYTVTLDYF